MWIAEVAGCLPFVVSVGMCGLCDDARDVSQLCGCVWICWLFGMIGVA